MKGKIYESSHFNIKPNTLTNDSTIRLNWNVFKIHVSKCEKCQNKCLVCADKELPPIATEDLK